MYWLSHCLSCTFRILLDHKTNIPPLNLIKLRQLQVAKIPHQKLRRLMSLVSLFPLSPGVQEQHVSLKWFILDDPHRLELMVAPHPGTRTPAIRPRHDYSKTFLTTDMSLIMLPDCLLLPRTPTLWTELHVINITTDIPLHLPILLLLLDLLEEKMSPTLHIIITPIIHLIIDQTDQVITLQENPDPQVQYLSHAPVLSFITDHRATTLLFHLMTTGDSSEPYF